MIDRALHAVWDRVDAAVRVPAASLGAFRWIFGGYLLLFDARWFGWLDQTPDAFFDPPVLSVAYPVGGFPPAPFFAALDAVWLLCVLLMTWGVRTRITTAVALAAYLLGATFVYSHGKISHQIAIAMILLCMTIADWGRAPQRRIAQGLALLAVGLSFGFLAAGFDKARHWLTPDLGVSGLLSWYYPRMELLTEPRLLAGLVPGTPLPLLKLADIAAVVFELSWFIALFAGRVPWRVWLFVATGFHLVNALVLNITFTTQVVVYLAFVDLTRLPGVRRLGARAGARIRMAAGAVTAVVAAWHAITRLGGTGSFLFLGGAGSETSGYDLYLSVAVCAVVLALIASDVVPEAAVLRQRARSRSRPGRARSATRPPSAATPPPAP